MNPLVAAIYNDFTQDNRKATDYDTLPNGKKDWSRYNATVVGAQWVPNQPKTPIGLPGLELAPKPTYRMVSFAAKREYGPDEGWIHVGKRGKKWRPRYVDREPVAEE